WRYDVDKGGPFASLCKRMFGRITRVYPGKDRIHRVAAGKDEKSLS
ncbi:hypothetical protein TNCV_21881, partial [Trichonephila clavipes]